MTTTEISPAALDVLAGHHTGVLATIHRDGRPQLSTVSYTFDPTTNLIRISITADRAKYRNVKRDPRAAFHVSTAHRGYAVAEGHAELSEVARSTDDETVNELIDVYRAIAGEHPDWDDYRRAMVADRRVVLRLRADRIYGLA